MELVKHRFDSRVSRIKLLGFVPAEEMFTPHLNNKESGNHPQLGDDRLEFLNVDGDDSWGMCLKLRMLLEMKEGQAVLDGFVDYLLIISFGMHMYTSWELIGVDKFCRMNLHVIMNR